MRVMLEIGRAGCARHRAQPCDAAPQSLADLLSKTHRGYVVHPRPDKNTLDQQ